MSTARLEAFSDGVFAIAATLLVLELHVPAVEHDLAGALLAQWPIYVAYLTSFVTIGIIWVNHHSLFAHVRHVDRTLMFLNLLLLLFVSIIPFPTAMLGQYALAAEGSQLAAALYGAVMFLLGLAFTLLWLRVTVDRHSARREGLLFQSGLVLYLVGIALSLVNAQLGMLVYALLAVFYVFPWLPQASTSDAKA